MVSSAVIGAELPPLTATMERGRLRAFAKATGQRDPAYVDVVAAAEAGHPDLPVPPTFLLSIELEAADPFEWLSNLGVDLRFVLHGEQRFQYHRIAHAGEELTARSWIADVYTKRGGALEFIVKQTAVTDAAGGAVADLTGVLVVRHPEVSE